MASAVRPAIPRIWRAATAIAGLVLISTGSGIRAQDVTVGQAVWLTSAPAPDEMPRVKGRLRVDYPDEMRPTPELGYTFVLDYVDSKGHGRTRQALGTLAPFQRAVERELETASFVPGKLNGKPVNSGFWIPVIFNPKSAAPKSADATPRLLSVSPAIVDDDPLVPGPPPMVPVSLSIATDGTIAKSQLPASLESDTRAAIEKALHAWRFAPARKNGQAIASDLVVPVICIAPPWLVRGPFVPPHVTRQNPPTYPIAMRRYGLVGRVLVDFVVDREGHVRNPFIKSSTNPAFDDPAIKAVRQWTFEPGTRNGRPVNSHMNVPIVFQLDRNPFSLASRDRFGGSEPFSISSGDQSKLPPELQYDTPPRIRNVEIPVYPYEDRRDGVRGTATVSMLIGPDGHVVGVKVLSATRSEFGWALAAAVEGFQFDPALKAGKPTMCLLKFEQRFSDDDLPDEAADDLLRLERKHPEKILGAGKLDGRLKPVSVRPGIFPSAATDAKVTEGSALIEGLVDEDGRFRLPRIIKSSAPEFGFAAVQAASAWWLTPPRSGGRPAVVRVAIPFKFTSH